MKKPLLRFCLFLVSLCWIPLLLAIGFVGVLLHVFCAAYDVSVRILFAPDLRVDRVGWHGLLPASRDLELLLDFLIDVLDATSPYNPKP